MNLCTSKELRVTNYFIIEYLLTISFPYLTERMNVFLRHKHWHQLLRVFLLKESYSFKISGKSRRKVVRCWYPEPCPVRTSSSSSFLLLLTLLGLCCATARRCGVYRRFKLLKQFQRQCAAYSLSSQKFHMYQDKKGKKMDGDHRAPLCSEQPAVYMDTVYPWSFPKDNSTQSTSPDPPFLHTHLWLAGWSPALDILKKVKNP